jgi:hypothetical protein
VKAFTVISRIVIPGQFVQQEGDFQPGSGWPILDGIDSVTILAGEQASKPSFEVDGPAQVGRRTTGEDRVDSSGGGQGGDGLQEVLFVRRDTIGRGYFHKIAGCVYLTY